MVLIIRNSKKLYIILNILIAYIIYYIIVSLLRQHWKKSLQSLVYDVADSFLEAEKGAGQELLRDPNSQSIRR